MIIIIMVFWLEVIVMDSLLQNQILHKNWERVVKTVSLGRA